MTNLVGHREVREGFHNARLGSDSVEVDGGIGAVEPYANGRDGTGGAGEGARGRRDSAAGEEGRGHGWGWWEEVRKRGEGRTKRLGLGPLV